MPYTHCEVREEINVKSTLESYVCLAKRLAVIKFYIKFQYKKSCVFLNSHLHLQHLPTSQNLPKIKMMNGKPHYLL